MPAKVLKEVQGKTLLDLHLYRARQSQKAQVFTVATTHEEGAETIMEIASRNGFETLQGSTDDVLDRFYQAALPHKADYIVRLTSDCPLLDPQLLDSIISFAVENGLDYATNTLVPDYPDGQDVEVFKFSALKEAWEKAPLKSDREHVTPYIVRNTDFKGGTLFKAKDFKNADDFGGIRMTVDEQKDFEAIEVLVNALGFDSDWKTYTDYVIEHIEEFSNQEIIRNEGYLKSLKKD